MEVRTSSTDTKKNSLLDRLLSTGRGRLALVLGLMAVFSMLLVTFGVFGETRIGISLRTRPAVENGLMAYWTFDATSISGVSVTDASGNGKTGTLIASSTLVFTTAGTSTIKVPANVSEMTIKAWGAGGGSAGSGSGAGSNGGAGGGGGFASVTVSVDPGESLSVIVGDNGGAGTNNASCIQGSGGGGGGYSAVHRNHTYFLMAPGGGGGSGGDDAGGTEDGGSGGAGGGDSGLEGSVAAGAGGDGGGGATQSAGGSAGAAGTGGGADGLAGSISAGGRGGENGSGCTGGTAGAPGGAAGGTAASANSGGGGGGGGGYRGGGGGEAGVASTAEEGAGGGGGGSATTTGTLGVRTSGAGRTPGNSTDPDYAGTAGQGGATTTGTATSGSAGSDGRVVIRFDSAMSSTSPGRIGQAWNLNGIGDYVQVGNVGSGVQTISFWFKTATTTFNMKMFDIDGTDQIELSASARVTATSFPAATVYVNGSSASTAIATSTWYHVVITDTTGVNASAFKIGRVNGNYFGGVIDDVRLYSRVLKSSEISELYHLGATTRVGVTLNTNPDNANGLVGHWKFDAGTVNGSVVSDASGNANDGSAAGSTNSDPHASAVTLLLKAEGSDASTTFTDSSPIARTVTTNGDAQIDTAIYKVDGGSGLFDGTGDFLSMVDSDDFDFSGGIWTVDFWVYPTDDATDHQTIYSQETSSTVRFLISRRSSGAIRLFAQNGVSGFINQSVGSVPSGEWSHVAVVENGDDYYIFINGTQVYTTNTTSRLANMTTSVYVANTQPTLGGALFPGQLDEFRVTKGVARWTSDFGPPPPPATAPGRIGQALDFDGTDDKIVIPDVDNLDLTSAMTIAGWVKIDSAAGTQAMMITKIDSTSAKGGYGLFRHTDNKFYCQGGDGVTWTSLNVITSNTFTDTSTWYHVVCTFDGTTGRLYVNGVADGTDTSATLVGNAKDVWLGRNVGNDTATLDGKLDDVRIYNRALSEDEIERLYGLGATTHVNTTIAGSSQSNGLVGHWTFDGPTMSGTAGTEPDSVSGLQLWLDATTGVSHTANAVDTWADQSGNGRNFTGSGTARPTLVTAGQNGLDIIRFDGTNDELNNATALSSYIANSAHTTFVAGSITPATNNANGWENDAFINDTAGYFGLFATTSPLIYAYNYDGNADMVSKTITSDTPLVAMMRHEGGNLYVAVDGGSESGGASGNTGVLTGVLQIGQTYTNSNWTDMDIYEILVYNTALSASDVTGVTNYLRNKWNGLSLLSTSDQSGNGNSGDVNGATRVVGRLGQALDFDGTDDYVEITDTDTYSFGNGTTDSPLTFAAWVYMDDATKFRIVSKGNTPLANYEYDFTVSNSDFLTLILYDSPASNAIRQTADASATSDQGQWVHYAGTYDGSGVNSGIKLYRNGVLVASTGLDGGTYAAMNNASGSFYIGSSSGGDFANGKIDDVRVYNRALSASEVEKLYQLGR